MADRIGMICMPPTSKSALALWVWLAPAMKQVTCFLALSMRHGVSGPRTSGLSVPTTSSSCPTACQENPGLRALATST
jgi:hypothetical protein